MQHGGRPQFSLAHEVFDRQPLVGLACEGDYFQNPDFQRLQRWQGLHISRDLSKLEKPDIDICRAGTFTHMTF